MPEMTEQEYEQRYHEWWEEDISRLDELSALARQSGAMVQHTGRTPALRRDGSLLVRGKRDKQEEEAQTDTPADDAGDKPAEQPD